MAYPFMPNLNIDEGISRKLKIISIAYDKPIIKVCEEIVDYYWDEVADKEKLKEAERKLKEEE